MTAPLIYITGCDGTGKSTQASLLVAAGAAGGKSARRVWLRFPFFFSAPLLAYARTQGLSWHETSAGVRHGYWDFRSSRVMRLFPWLLLVDAALAGCWNIFLPLWHNQMIVCERYVLDMLVDLSLAFNDKTIFTRLPFRWYFKLLPRQAVIILLDLDAQTIRARRPDLISDKTLEQRLSAYRALAAHLNITPLSSQDTIENIQNHIRRACNLQA